MTITLITPQEYKTLKDIYDNDKGLFLQNTGYQYIGKRNLSDENLKNITTISDILSKHVGGFCEFSNFRLSKDNKPQIRLQYDYGHGNNSRSFTGVGYILLDELLNGFNK